MPKPIQDAGLSTSLVERYRLTGRTLFQLDETLVPTVQVGDLSAAAFSPKIGAERFAAVALEQSAVALLNPAGSGVMIVLDHALVGTSGSSEMGGQFNANAGVAPVGASESSQDRRQPIGAVTGQIIAGSEVALVRSLVGFETNQQAALSQLFPMGFYIPPGEDIGFMNPTVNQDLAVTFWWREIPLQLFGL